MKFCLFDESYSELYLVTAEMFKPLCYRLPLAQHQHIFAETHSKSVYLFLLEFYCLW